MRGTYPGEVRVRVIGLVEAGASRREAAEQLEISASSAVRWLSTGKQRAFLGQNHAEEAFLRWSGMRSGYALVIEQPDLTLDEIVSAMREHNPRQPLRTLALLRTP